MKEIKFRRPLYKENGQFSHFSVWGVNINKSDFVSPGQANYAPIAKEDEQFTGILDRHGKEIFEGDEVEFKYSSGAETKIVTFEKGVGSCGCCYAEFSGSGFVMLNENYDHETNRLNVEVIGNIHEGKPT
jgi:hypothetical protein